MIKHYDIDLPKIKYEAKDPVLSFDNKIRSIIMEHSNYIEEKLTDGVIQAAIEAGVNEIYLIDRDEVKKAIVEYYERKNRIAAQKEYNIKTLSASITFSENDYSKISKLLAYRLVDEVAPYIKMQPVDDEFARKIGAMRYNGTLKILV